MQTILDLVNKLGVPAGIAIMAVALVYLWKYYENLRSKESAARELREQARDEANNKHMADMVAGFWIHQDRMSNDFKASMKDIVEQLRENRRTR